MPDLPDDILVTSSFSYLASAVITR